MAAMVARPWRSMGRALTAEEIAAYDHVPRQIAERARLHPVRWLASGAHGMTLGHHILLVRGHEGDPKLVAHELVHVRQYAERGWIRFLSRYLLDYLGNLRRLRSHRQAYLAIPAEAEARELAGAWAKAHG
jgi:Domain of unknown function (DUF4157)